MRPSRASASVPVSPQTTIAVGSSAESARSRRSPPRADESDRTRKPVRLSESSRACEWTDSTSDWPPESSNSTPAGRDAAEAENHHPGGAGRGGATPAGADQPADRPATAELELGLPAGLGCKAVDGGQ